jgi:hypothetical protein
MISNRQPILPIYDHFACRWASGRVPEGVAEPEVGEGGIEV